MPERIAGDKVVLFVHGGGTPGAVAFDVPYQDYSWMAFLAAAGPLIDLRSPAEFAQGHIPGATNLPLFDNDERAEIGTLYKQEGRQAAVMRGLALVGPRMERLAATLAAAAARIPDPRQHSGGATPPLARNASGASGPPPLRIHCWRGGMRSGSVAWLAGQLDLPVLLLEGGYKTYRHWVLERFEQPWPLRLLGGRTGCGKTDLLLALRERGVAVLDLEGRAHHRGWTAGRVFGGCRAFSVGSGSDRGR
jgi:tRNA 2-selenouridine synthase